MMEAVGDREGSQGKRNLWTETLFQMEISIPEPVRDFKVNVNCPYKILNGCKRVF